MLEAVKLSGARPRGGGFTLVELLIVVALAAVVLGLAAPSFSRFIQMQRLRGVNAQLVTDIQFARSEAVSRNVPIHLRFQGNAQMGCYVLYTTTNANLSCDCTAAEGSRCTNAATREVRTVQLPTSGSVFLSIGGNPSDRFSFDPRTGGLVIPASDNAAEPPTEFLVHAYLDNPRKLRNIVGLAGRVKVCSPNPAAMGGTAC